MASRRPPPTSDAELWKMLEVRAVECLQSVMIVGSSKSQGEELNRRPLAENRERAKYAALDYMQRLGDVGNETGDVNGMLIEWKEVRMADDCAQTLLKIKTLANAMRKCAKKIECRKSRPNRGRGDMEMINRGKYGRLPLTAEVYPCLKRSFVALEASRRSRIGKCR